MHSYERRRRELGLLMALSVFPLASFGQEAHLPTIRLIVGWPPGGTSDGIARTVGMAMSSALGTPVVIDNRPGAGGNIGTELAAHAKPDGTTILLATGASHGINPALYSRLGYDPIKDFAPIGMISTASSILVVSASSPFRTLSDLLAKAKAAPDKLTVGSAGYGSSGHIAATMLQQRTGLRFTHVPYKGGAPAMTDLLAGQVDFMLDSGVIPLIRSGKLRALAVAAPRRLPSLPDVPTFAEAGVANFNTSWWTGLVAPAGTPRQVLDRLHAALDTALRSPAVQQKLLDLSAVADPRSIDEFWAFVHEQLPILAKVVKDTGAKIE